MGSSGSEDQEAGLSCVPAACRRCAFAPCGVSAMLAVAAALLACATTGAGAGEIAAGVTRDMLAAGAADDAVACAAVPATLRISCNTYNISFSTNETTCHARGCCWDGQVDTANGPSCYYSSPAVPIKKVVIINADHFDLGYHGLIKDVANMYFVSARGPSHRTRAAG